MDDLKKILMRNTVGSSTAFDLGMWFLAHGPATTGQLADWGRDHGCSSVMERLRCDIRGRCQWPVKSRRIKGRKTHIYWIEGVHQEPKAE